MKIGDFELEFKEFKQFELLPFIPFFQRFVATAINTRQDLRKKFEMLLKEEEKNPDDEGLKEEIEKVSNMINSETETATIKLFENFNEYEWKRIKNFLINHIKSWNLQTKNKGGEFIAAPINEANFDKIPLSFIPMILTEVATKILITGEEINFFIPSSKKEQKNTKKAQKGAKETA